MLKVTVGDIMTEEVVTIKEDATVSQAAHILLRFRISGLLITKVDDRNKVVGILTTTDLLKLLDALVKKTGGKLSDIESLSEMPAILVASTDIFTLDKDTKIEKVITLMLKENKHTMPVYDKDKLVGIIGRHDVLNAAYG